MGHLAQQRAGAQRHPSSASDSRTRLERVWLGFLVAPNLGSFILQAQLVWFYWHLCLWARPPPPTAEVKEEGQQEGNEHRKGSVPRDRPHSAVPHPPPWAPLPRYGSPRKALITPVLACTFSGRQGLPAFLHLWMESISISASNPSSPGAPPSQALWGPPILTSCVHRVCTYFPLSPA